MSLPMYHQILLKFSSTKEDKEEKEEKDNNYNNKSNIEMVYINVEKMRDIFLNNIGKIIKGKKRLYEFSQNILIIIDKFDDFFNIISAITKKFDVINLLTRIEIARSSEVLKTIGAALSEISKLPQLIKDNVTKSLLLYNNTRDVIKSAVKEYFDTFNKQELILNECSENMKIMSIKLFSSKKYYSYISLGFQKKSSDTLNFLKELEDKQFQLIETEKIFNDVTKKFESSYEENEDYDNISLFKNELTIIKNHIEKKLNKKEYRTQMILSLLN